MELAYRDEPNGEPELADVEAIQKGARELADKIVEDWVTDAHNHGVADISPWTPEHEDLVWRNFQKKFGTKIKANLVGWRPQ